MKKETLHIVWGEGNSLALKSGLSMKGVKAEVLSFPSMFECGYLPKDLSDKELILHLASFGVIGLLDKLKDFVTKDFSIYEKVIVWHGNNANELLMLYFICSFIDANLYHIDITKKTIPENSASNSVQMLDLSPANICDMGWMEEILEPISVDKQVSYKLLWNKWTTKKGYYRRYSKEINYIEILDEGFMDKTICEVLQKESDYGMAVGKLMGLIKDFGDRVIGDRVLKYVCSINSQNYDIYIKPHIPHMYNSGT